MTILAFDTATETLAVAAARGDDWVAHSCNGGLKHAALLAPLIERVTAELGMRVADVDLVATGIGPGSFTGVRIGVATAKGIAAAGRARLAGVCGLDTMAWEQRHAGGLVVPLIDARKRRFYAACYRAGRRVGPYLDQAPAELADTVRATAAADEPVLLTGPAAAPFEAAAAVVPAGWQVDRRRAQIPVLAMLELAAANTVAAVADLKPLYLRRSEAELGIAAPKR